MAKGDNKQQKFSMMGGNGRSSNASPASMKRGYTARSKPVGDQVSADAGAAASSSSSDAATPIGCHAGNVYESKYMMARCYAGDIVTTIVGAQACQERGEIPSWTLANDSAIQYRSCQANRGTQRFGNAQRALVEEVRVMHVKNDFPFAVMLVSNQLKGRTYASASGVRGLMSVPSNTTLSYEKGRQVYLTPQINSTFLRYANVEAGALLREKFEERRLGNDGTEVIRYAVPKASTVGQLFFKNSTENKDAVRAGRKNLNSVGIGAGYKVQLHVNNPKTHYDLSPEDFNRAVAMLVTASNKGSAIDMLNLDIGVVPVSGSWSDSKNLSVFEDGKGTAGRMCQMSWRVEFEIEVRYRLLDHPDMHLQQ